MWLSSWSSTKYISLCVTVEHTEVFWHLKTQVYFIHIKNLDKVINLIMHGTFI